MVVNTDRSELVPAAVVPGIRYGRDFRVIAGSSTRRILKGPFLVNLELPIVFEVASLVILTLILVADLLIVYKRPHVPSVREATLWVVFYVGLALIFALLMLIFGGGEHAGQFLAGWLTEYSLSIDNLFVFVIIMARFSVPRKYQRKC